MFTLLAWLTIRKLRISTVALTLLRVKLSTSLETGIANPIAPGQAAACYPKNPATYIINIRLNENIPGDLLLEVFDTYGKEVKSMACQQLSGNDAIQFSVADLSSG
jgi:hypothetical protein